MSKVNEEIISRINVLPEEKHEVKVFLLWLMQFERDHSDRTGFAFKQELIDHIRPVETKHD